MKFLKLNILIVFLLFPICLFSQTDTTITSLNGFEDSSGSTHLFYQTHYSNLGEAIDTSLSNIYHLSTSTLSNTIFLHGETHTNRQTLPPFDTDGKTISGLSFFNNGPARYIYIHKSGISLSANKIIKAGVGEVFSTSGNIRFLYISKQDTNNVYAVLDNLILKSTDGGNTWPDIADTNNVSIDFIPIVFSPFDDNVIFGFDNYGRLIQSYDGGKHSSIVQPDNIWNEKSQICFDVNNEYIYAATESDGSTQVMESHNQGNSYTWEDITWFEGKINFEVDKENSGSFYYTNGFNMFHSSNYGLTIDTLFTFSSMPVDFYKKQGQDTFYIAYSNRIEKISSDNSQILNKFSINNTLSLFPLSIGNLWVYYYSGQSWVWDGFPQFFDGYTTIKIVKDSIFNNHRYYKIFNSNVYCNNWTRLDSVTGQILIFDEYYGKDQLSLDFLAEGHSYFNVREGQIYNSVTSDTTLWDKRRLRKHFDFSSLYVVSQEYAQGLGLIHEIDGFDFGSSESLLQGCVINGVVYGDTTIVVGVSEDGLTTLPKKYKLYQNYPNPFNPTTTIQYNLPKAVKVELAVYDVLGRKVKTLVNEFQPQGFYNVEFDAAGLSGGIYIYRIVTSNFSTSRKMILLK